MRKNNKIYRMKSSLTNQKGMALLTTLIFVFVLVTLAVALLTMTNNDTKMSTLQRESNKAFYLADAGIEDALWKLNTAVVDGGEDIDYWRPTNEPADPGTATEYYQITIESIDAENIKITSTGSVIGGKFSSGKRKIEVTAEIDYITSSIYDHAILAEKIILFQGTPGPDIVGDVHSNDDILVSGQFADTYLGNATCSGDTNDVNSDNTGADDIPLPFVDYGALKAISDSLGNTILGDVSLGNAKSFLEGTALNPLTGIHFIDGDLEGKNGSEIHIKNGAIIVTGNVNIKEGALLNIKNDEDYLDPEDPNTALALVAQGNIKIYAKADIGIGVVQSVLADGLTSEGFIELKNGCTVTGSVIADTVYLRNKSAVNYTTSLNQFTTKGDPFFKKTSWRETY